jgi:hypothetical protein
LSWAISFFSVSFSLPSCAYNSDDSIWNHPPMPRCGTAARCDVYSNEIFGRPHPSGVQ